MGPPLPVYTPRYGHRQSFNRTLAPAHCPGTPLHGNQVGVPIPYGLTVQALEDFLPVDARLNDQTVRNHTLAVAQG